MLYGLIGEKLIHSFSKEIHRRLAGYDYELCELKKSELPAFFEKRDFKGINVTIPYKTDVIEYLDEIDEAAKAIGAVNTVINRGGRLTGYNTDAFGLTCLINKNGIEIENKKVLVLGGGGTSNTATYVARSMGAASVIRVSRSKKDGFITYGEAAKDHADADVIINATPCGMFPDSFDLPIDIDAFFDLSGVVDVIYNPLKTRLVLKAQNRGIKAAGGLYMLVAQAYKAAELFTGEAVGRDKLDKVYNDILLSKQNIVLIGMPSAGKTTVGRMLSAALNMPFFDSDEQITEKTGRTPAEIIKSDGELAFRKTESETIRELSAETHVIIATGGGAITVKENALSLKSNGRIYFIDRPLDMLTVTPDRPLSSSIKALKTVYENRIDLYRGTADIIVKNDTDINTVCERIRKDFYENFSC